MGIFYKRAKKDGTRTAYGSFSVKRIRYNGHPLRNWNDNKEPADKKEAAAAFDKFKTDCRNGTIGVDKTLNSGMTVADFVIQYLERYMDRKGRTSDRSTIRIIGAYFGKKPMAVFERHTTFQEFKSYLQDTPISIVKVSKKDGVKKVEWIKGTKKRQPATINRFLKRCQHMCNFAVANQIIEKNPFLGDHFTDLIGYEEEPEGRQRGVTEDELDRLFANASTELTERLNIALLFGVRRGEMQRAQLEDIDYTEWLWTIPGSKIVDGETVRNTKNGKSRVVPIPSDVKIRALFTEKRKLFNRKAFLFGENGRYVASFNGGWMHLKDVAGLSDEKLKKAGKVGLHWHDIRGEAATRMLRNGYSAELVADIVGNTPAVLRKHYKGDLLAAMRTALTGTR